MRRLLPLVHPFDPLQPNSMHFLTLLVFVTLTFLTSTRASPVSRLSFRLSFEYSAHLAPRQISVELLDGNVTGVMARTVNVGPIPLIFCSIQG